MKKLNFVNRWHSDVFPSKEIGTPIFIDLKKNLKISPHPFSSWRSIPNQRLKTITINENGLRSKPLKNLKFKNNAILLGGSVAWGFGATSNENIPSYLIEKILFEKYGLEYNVINLAEQMFTSFEELKVFMLSKRFIYRHKWSLGDIVATDNLAGMHRATAFNEDTERRTIHRITIKGKAPLEAHYV